MGILQGLEKSLAKNPRQILNLLASGDTNMEQILGFIQNMTNGNTNKAREIALEKFKNANMNEAQFRDFSRIAKKMGADDRTLSELKQYIK